MASLANLLLSLLLLATFSPTTILCFVNPAPIVHEEDATKTSAYQTYIVLVEPPPSNVGEDGHRQWYESFLPSSHVDESGEPRLIHSYTEVFSGFAARLAVGELQIVAKKAGFIRAFPDQRLQLLTTHTPEFLGLQKGTGFWSAAGYGKGVIVGLLDSGIYAPHPSFDDHDIPPPPTKWKGSCKAARCNNKLIGAQSLLVGENDTGDKIGHGTHTSSTAAGNSVIGASYHGLGAGTAAGIAAGAHIAMYKVCYVLGCDVSAILAGIDAAIKDGVDVLSISIGSPSVSFDRNPMAIGTFSAVSRGIIVVCGAGNNGQKFGSVINDAPWLLTVGAGSVDRSFRASVHPGNGKRIDGEALTQVAKSSSNLYPLHYEKERECYYGNGSSNVISGKIVVCDEISVGQSTIHDIMAAGAAGVVVSCYDGYATELRNYNSSVVQVTTVDGEILKTLASTSM